MRTPVVVVTGQSDTGDIGDLLLADGATALVEHHVEDHVVHRTTTVLRRGVLVKAVSVIEMSNGCPSCAVREDLVDHLCRLHLRPDLARIAVLLSPWMEPEPVCVALSRSPAARHVAVSAVVATVNTSVWLDQALGDDELDDGRTVAQVVVGQVEFADVVVLTEPHRDTLAVVRRLAPAARITVGAGRFTLALANLDADARRGRGNDPYGSLLAGQPPLEPAGRVRLVEFAARRPFHPNRLHAAVDLLLEGVVRSRGRLWLAHLPDTAVGLDSAGGGLLVTRAGKWLAAMTSRELAYVGAERRAMADMMWDDRYGDRHTSMTVLVCGADPAEIVSALRGALLTDAEMGRPQDWPRFDDPFGDWQPQEARLA
ncbi:hypothetical protein CYL16_10620 [Mycobacterium sp. EPG1]|nr:hypothetical protein CYL16_10620 [Mycobacterium sp. EPG1]